MDGEEGRKFKNCAYFNGKMLTLVHKEKTKSSEIAAVPGKIEKALPVTEASVEENKTFECGICLDEHDEEEAFTLEYCQHKFCIDSAKKHIITELR